MIRVRRECNSRIYCGFVACKIALILLLLTSNPSTGWSYHFPGQLWEKFNILVCKSNTNKNTGQLKSFICRTVALAFLPIHFVCFAWQGVKANTPELPRINEFIMYFDNHMDNWNIPCSRVELIWDWSTTDKQSLGGLA